MKARILGIVLFVFVFIAGCGRSDSGKSDEDNTKTVEEQTPVFSVGTP